MGRIKSRFVRALIECIQQETSGKALARLRSELPPHLLRLLSREVLGGLAPDATLDLDAGIELLLVTDRLLAGGSGMLTSRANAALASRVLSQSSGLVVPGDTFVTLQHLRAPFEQPFVDVALRFLVRRASDGFALELQLPGNPRAAQWLGGAGTGYIMAAARFSGDNFSALRLETELAYDITRVVARRGALQTVPVPPPVEAPASPRQPSGVRRRPPTNASERVQEILNRATSASGARRGPAAPPPLPRSRKLAP